MNPINVEGTAILVPTNIGAYTRGTFTRANTKRYVSVVGMCVYRDADGNRRHDMSDDKIDTGFFGINIHKADASVQVTWMQLSCLPRAQTSLSLWT